MPKDVRLHLCPISPILLAHFCHAEVAKNRVLLPEKWAKTSVVVLLQHLHNQNA